MEVSARRENSGSIRTVFEQCILNNNCSIYHGSQKC